MIFIAQICNSEKITVFGESILNDGVAVVLFEVFESFLGLDELHLELNLVRVFLKFAIVAGGGTILGFVYGFVGTCSHFSEFYLK